MKRKHASLLSAVQAAERAAAELRRFDEFVENGRLKPLLRWH